MNELNFSSDFITYHEMVDIISPKFNCTHDEIRYWIKIAHELDHTRKSPKPFGEEIDPNLLPDGRIIEMHNHNYLKPFASDLKIGNVHLTPPDGFFYPHYYFYKKTFVNLFIAPPLLRFVYRRDLTGKRNWHDMRESTSDSLIERTLMRANECGILRLYDKETDDFTLFASDSRLWCDMYPTDFSDSSTFFLLFDILNLERIFFKKSWDLCMKELIGTNVAGENDHSDSNIIKFKKREKKHEN